MLSRVLAKPLTSSEIANRIEAVKSALALIEAPFKAYLFGSAARQQMDCFSDVDVYVIFSKADDLRQWSKTLYSTSIHVGFPIDWVLVTKEHFEERSKIGGLAYEVAHEGILAAEWGAL